MIRTAVLILFLAWALLWAESPARPSSTLASATASAELELRGSPPRSSSGAVICRVFRSRCSAARRVAWCESRFNARAVGDAGERGLFQIHPVHFGWLNPRRLFEPLYNARAAFLLSAGGRDWHMWACQP